MKFTLGWLRDHLDTDADLATITERLTALGLEVESVTDRASELASFTVAHVVEAVPHPNADRLRLCKVDTGSEVLDVICGAPNARTGIKAVFAPIGSIIPGSGMKLEKKPIRGITGYGMLCSEREMGLGDNHDGIIELPEDAPLGRPFAEVMGLDDPVIDIAITPNRGDCLGVLGIARDLAAAGLGRLKDAAPPAVPGTFASPISVRLAFDQDAANACPHFVGRTIRGVRNGPSPAWMQQRLMAVGLRPISALVDITNYVMLDRARPLHVFDADAIAGSIHVRLSRPGESLAALNDRTYTLDDAVTVVADDDGPVALGGVIGGEGTGCSPETTTVFLESALFDPIRTAATGRKLSVDSDARHRFERGIDREGCLPGAEFATRLILDICGGEASELAIAGEAPAGRGPVHFRPSRVHALGGLDMAKAESEAVLDRLGFASEDQGEVLSVSVPSWRNDIDGEADLVEEVLRVHGYDAIPAVSLQRAAAVAGALLTTPQRRRREVRRVLAARGMVEAVTWSFLPSAHATLFGGGAPELALANPISADLDMMRPSPLPNLVAAAQRNQDRGFDQIALFEVGPQYAGDSPDDQSVVAAGIRAGATGPRHWLAAGRPVDAFDAKADALAVLNECGVPVDRLQVVTETPSWYHPGRSGELRLGPKAVLARFGELHPGLLAEMDVDGPVVAFEVLMDALPIPKAKPTKARPLLAASDYPAVDRDFAFVVDEAVPVATFMQAIRSLSGKTPQKVEMTDVGVFDIYTGANVAEGKKSVALSVRFQPQDRTLTDADIQALVEAIVDKVSKATGGALRS
ncbi:MAG: phenylalanine--tRNA ligase subunit beta [Rhodospirillaceae bacterium]|nr:phenylalanine--tRNA ligase subunit beta [Rhodospirillaceae bacterium]